MFECYAVCETFHSMCYRWHRILNCKPFWVILMVNENWFHNNIGCAGFNLFGCLLVYLFNFLFYSILFWIFVFGQDKHKISIVNVCRHQWRSNKLTNLFWLFSDNVVGCHMSSTTTAVFSKNRKCELYFSVSRVIHKYDSYVYVDEGKTFRYG